MAAFYPKSHPDVNSGRPASAPPGALGVGGENLLEPRPRNPLEQGAQGDGKTDEEEQWPEDGAKAFRNGTSPRLWRGGLRSSSVLLGLVRHHSSLLGSGSALSAFSA